MNVRLPAFLMGNNFARAMYPEYPKFTVQLSASNLKQPTEDVIRWLAGGIKNNLATAVLDGLELLDLNPA